MKQLKLPQIASVLSTFDDILRKAYLDHPHFRSCKVIREVFVGERKMSISSYKLTTCTTQAESWVRLFGS